MKKIFTILFSVGVAISAAAQHGYQSANDYNYKNDKPAVSNGNGSYQKDNHQQENMQWANNQQNGSYRNKDYSNNDRPFNGRQPQMQEKDRRAAIDRVNRDYDQRINRYRNDRSINNYERDRRIAEAQRGRQQQISSFGKGAITGAIVGLLAGVLFSQ